MLVYESYRLGSVVPKALVRMEAMRKAREMGERLRHWIEGHHARVRQTPIECGCASSSASCTIKPLSAQQATRSPWSCHSR